MLSTLQRFCIPYAPGSDNKTDHNVRPPRIGETAIKTTDHETPQCNLKCGRVIAEWPLLQSPCLEERQSQKQHERNKSKNPNFAKHLHEGVMNYQLQLTTAVQCL